MRRKASLPHIHLNPSCPNGRQVFPLLLSETLHAFCIFYKVAGSIRGHVQGERGGAEKRGEKAIKKTNKMGGAERESDSVLVFCVSISVCVRVCVRVCVYE